MSSCMTENLHPKTQIPCGVLHAQGVMELWSDITADGTNVSWEYARQEVKDKLQEALKKEHESSNNLQDAIIDVIENCYHDPDIVYEGILQGLTGQDDGVEARAMCLLQRLEDNGLWDYYEEQEDTYKYDIEISDGCVKLELGYLGGGALLFVTESPFVAVCRHCSPCCPNAGDLDCPLPKQDPPDLSFVGRAGPRSDLGATAAVIKAISGDTALAYCLPQEDMPEDWGGTAILLPDFIRALHEEGDENEQGDFEA